MRKKPILGICLCLGIAMLSSCSDSTKLKLASVDVDTIYINKDDSMELAEVESFEESYYSQSELKDFIEDAIKDYEGTEGAGKVEMKDFSVKDKVAKVLLTFDKPDTYTGFQGVNLQLIESADLQDNMVMPDTFVDAEGKTVDKDTVLKEEGMKYLIVNEALELQIDGKIAYYSGANMTGDNLIQTAEDKTAVIVYK